MLRTNLSTASGAAQAAGRLGTAAEIVGPILFLSSPHAAPRAHPAEASSPDRGAGARPPPAEPGQRPPSRREISAHASWTRGRISSRRRAVGTSVAGTATLTAATAAPDASRTGAATDRSP